MHCHSGPFNYIDMRCSNPRSSTRYWWNSWDSRITAQCRVCGRRVSLYPIGRGESLAPLEWKMRKHAPLKKSLPTP